MVDSLKHHSSSSIMSDLKSLFSILGMRRRTKVFVYGFMFAFVACTAYIAFNPTSGGGSPWFNDFFATATASTAPYRSQLSSFISRFFANSTSPFGDGMGFDGGPVVENGSALSRPPGGGGDRVSEVQQGGVLGNVGSQKGGLLGKNQTTAPDGSSQNGVPTKSQTGTGVGSPKNSVSMKNQTREGVESSQNGVLVKNQTVVGDGSHQNGVLMKNQTMVVGLPKQTGLPPQNKTSGAGGAVKNSAPASSPAKGASVPVRNETLGKNQTYVGVVNPASGNASAPAPAKKNAPPAASSGSGQMGIVGGNSVSNFSASLSKDKGSPPSAGPASSHGNQKREWSVESMKGCDIFQGRWVKDDTYPLYPQGSCPHIDEPFNCYLNGRPDQSYQKLRWQPDGCNIPRLNGTHMLEKLRGKRLVFVGDSLNRNMWESLVCVLRNSVKDKKKVFEASGRQQFRTEGSYSFLFEDYGCSVEFFRSPFLVQEWEIPDTNGKKKETLRLDTIERSSSKYKSADIIVFNTGHWWTHDKTSKGKDYYQEGNRVYSELNVVEAFHKALNTWAKWVDVNVNPQKTLVVFRGYSSSHFSGGQWNSGGQCDSETEPIKNDKYLSSYPPKMRVLESVLKGMKTPVSYLNITRMTDYRKDAHPSIYRKQHLTEEERRSPEQYQDCSHWCLPGVPDSWNEILYAQILIKQNQLQ